MHCMCDANTVRAPHRNTKMHARMQVRRVASGVSRAGNA
jgi:hypothetical protein